ncbi:MAG: class I SAM-dependent methyltransferase [Candidatus Aminicenantia bacterium]
MVDKKEVFQLYKNTDFLTKLFIRIKLMICPFLQMEKYFPKKGKITDLGCGNGLFSNILKLNSHERKIIGYDLDENKIKIAKKTQPKINPAISFHQADIVEIDYPPSDVFCLSDVLYLIPFDKQEIILKKCFMSLKEGGQLIIKEVDTKPRWKYWWNFFQETLSVKVLNFTSGKNFYFRSKDEYLSILSKMGFKVNIVRLDKGYWYPHLLYLCYKK